jgi:hypothetical protein
MHLSGEFIKGELRFRMPSLYRNAEEKRQDILMSKMIVDNAMRYSLTEGGRYLPFSELEKEVMREDKAMAIARLVIDQIMQR